MAKDRTGKGVETVWIETCRSITSTAVAASHPADPIVPVGERTVDQLNPLALARRHRFKMQSFGGTFQGAYRNVQAEQACEASISQERVEQPALAAAEIRDATGAHVVKGSDHLLDALLIEIHRALEACLEGVSAGGTSVGVEVIVLAQTAQGIASQGSLIAEVAAGDQLALRMRCEPVAGATEELVDLIVADPIVLFAVESRNQYGEIRVMTSESSAVVVKRTVW